MFDNKSPFIVVFQVYNRALFYKRDLSCLSLTFENMSKYLILFPGFQIMQLAHSLILLFHPKSPKSLKLFVISTDWSLESRFGCSW